MHTTPTGYVYKAATYCPRCLPMTQPYVIAEGRPDYAVAESVERVLDNLAGRHGKVGALWQRTYGEKFDRHDETTFDSSGFPKVVLDEPYECDSCGEEFGTEYRHHHYYDSSLSAWQCRECGTAADYCDRD